MSELPVSKPQVFRLPDVRARGADERGVNGVEAGSESATLPYFQ